MLLSLENAEPRGMEFIGASQPDVIMEVTGASQPDVAEPCASSSSAWDPDVPSVVREVLELGRFPGRYKKPANDTEVRENYLAKQLSTQKQKILQNGGKKSNSSRKSEQRTERQLPTSSQLQN